MARRKGFFTTATPADDLARERDLAALVQTQRTVVQEIGIERIRPNPFQARQSFTDLDELADSIRLHGFTTRLRVRPHPSLPNTFELVYGERRLRAAGMVGYTSVPCEIADHSDADLIEIGLAENIQRRDLDPLEEARAFMSLIGQRGYSVRGLAERIGKDKSYVESRLALLRMPSDVQEMVAERPDTLRSAREIAKLATPATREPLIQAVVSGDLSTMAVREVVRDLNADAGVSIQREVVRDLQRISSILRRWEELLARGEDERAAVGNAFAQLTDEMEQFAERLLSL
ncbi:stage 0 sporulation protein J [Oscillochloris trichoides DG-6]|uniref:Stage 0 sporulation protein J n=1 Tax=Oscillochloris trichoides DG-6 TaxID=765420 RepID=E1I9P8_9CHLR|nr:ParB/RepB/Spo0J family partition protein [Oscillochloris trichoides]EFO82126.1 stage 0 sporulation protein J [Oscillochloris trichoides DG-6]